MTSIDDILNRLETDTKVPRTELMEKINKKQKELSGLVSIEGAAHLVAKEYGVNLSETSMKNLEIKDIIGGMNKFAFCGRIFRISNMVEFKRADGSTGKVVNVYLGDTSGYTKLVLWDKQVNLIEEETIKLDDVIEITNGFVKENTYGDIEVSLGKYGSIRSVEIFNLPSAEELNKKYFSPPNARVQIKNLIPGIFEISGTVIQVFKGKFIFNTCSICGSTMDETGEKPMCASHGDVEYNPSLVISMILDDGTDDIRVVIFRDMAEKIVEMKSGELVDMDMEKRYELISERLIGKQLVVRGRVKKNKNFDRIEMIANDFKELNPLDESKNLLEELNVKVGE